MVQKISPFLDAKYGWEFGESGWNVGMDENLNKFSFYIDGNINGVIDTLPPPVNGEAYFLTTDNNVYYCVANTWNFAKPPVWFEFKVKSSGAKMLFNGTGLVSISSALENSDVKTRVDNLVTTNGNLKNGVVSRNNLSEALKSSIDSVSNAQPKSDNLTALSNLSGSSDQLPYFTGAGTLALTGLSEAARSILDDPSIYQILNTLGIPITLPTIASLVDSNGIPTNSVNVLGYTVAGDKGWASYVKTNSSTGVFVTDAGGQKWALVPSPDRLVYQLGAKGGATGDDTPAFAKALANFREVRIPADDFNITTLSPSLQGFQLIGPGKTAAKLICTTANQVGISLPNGVNNFKIRGFTIDRSVTATTTAYGIDCSTVIVGQGEISDVQATRHYHGIGLGPTDHSIIEDVICEKNIGAGIRMTNTASNGAVQWNPKHVLVQKNGQQGILFQAVSGPTAVALGTFFWVDTYANSGAGIAIVGTPTTPVNGFRLLGGFIGEDGASEVFLDTYGVGHIINSCFIELPGSVPTGPNVGTASATAASKVGSGIEISVNNTDVSVNGTRITGCSFDGIVSACASLSVNGCSIRNNGVSLQAGRQNGIYITAGRAVVNGGMIGNVGGSVSQLYGIYTYDGKQLSETGVDLTQNQTAAIGAGTNLQFVGMVGNLPQTSPVQIASQSYVVVGGGTTPVTTATGVVNVSGGVVKNGTAYTNP